MGIFEKVESGGRISGAEASELFEMSLFDLAKMADIRRRQADSSDEVGYIVNRMVNYSNICNARCRFCAYHAKSGVVAPYRLTDDEIFDLCADAVKRGATELMLQGGLHPDFRLEWAEGILRRIKAAFPNFWLHVFSPSEIVWFARSADISVLECLKRLRAAGADSVPGAADILVPRVRSEVCGNKCTVDEWREVMRSLSKLGMCSSATMTFGIGETLAGNALLGGMVYLGCRVDHRRGALSRLIGIEAPGHALLHGHNHGAQGPAGRSPKSEGAGKDLREHARKLCDVGQNNDKAAHHVEQSHGGHQPLGHVGQAL